MFFEDLQSKDDNRRLTAKAEAPATVRLYYRNSGCSKFETLEAAALSRPPELPGMTKPPDAQIHQWLEDDRETDLLEPQEGVSALVFFSAVH